MRVIDYNMIPNGADTKTMQDLGALMGTRPEMSKAVVTLYPNLSLQKLTEQLGAVYAKDVQNLKEIESFSFEWLIKTNQIPRIRFAEDCVETGEGGAEFFIVLEKKFYDPRDTFELENEQQLFVKRVPEELAPNKWKYWVQLVSPELSKKVNTAYMTRGKTTRYVSNYQPELSERGYSKFMYNIEKHRNYISRHRVGDSVSGDFSKLKSKYLEHAGVYFKMSTMEKDLMDQIYLAFENSMLLGHGNFDDRGNCLITEEDGRPIPIGEGIITQVKRFCGQQRYSDLSATHFRNAIGDVVEKLPSKTGNRLVAVVNWRFYQQAQTVLDDLLKTRVTDNYFYTKSGGKIKVGAEYNAYEFSGNVITFMENQALTDRYPDRGYCLILDTGTYDGEPNISMHTIKGMSLFKGTQLGMGGKSGGESVENLGSMVHGHRVEYMGYRGAKVANPYGAHIIEESIV
jgi:hypothetical protein